MIIIEGMDNTGKSTLAKKLNEQFGLRIIKRSGPPKDNGEFLLDTLSFLVLNPQAIFDRHPIISEGIYGPILRDVNVFETEGTTWEFYIDRMVTNNPLIIYCRPPTEKVLCFKPNSQMSGVEENAKRLLQKYDALIGRLESRRALVIKYDFTQLVADVPIEFAVESYLRVTGGPQ